MNKEFMSLAFEEAKKALNNDDVPIGCVIVKNDKVISKGFNSKDNNNRIISHAEINAIIEAEKVFDNWRLDDCDLYVTLDPCPMCASAIKQARINNVYSALSNSDENNDKIIKMIFNNNDKTNKKVNFISNLDVEKSNSLLSLFFSKKRN